MLKHKAFIGFVVTMLGIAIDFLIISLSNHSLKSSAFEISMLYMIYMTIISCTENRTR
ncbi:hypothetical protein PSFL107428_01575 [Pseudoalteromonas maricaloris]